jgi:hypothetical protein
VPQYSAILLRNVSVLSAGTLLKKDHLNITTNNVISVYYDAENSHLYEERRKAIKKLEDSELYVFHSDDYNSNRVFIVRNRIIDEHLRNGRYPRFI